jgi:hypothetical protein
MKTEATPERIAKLPAWAREHITRLERRADEATDAVEAYLDNQTESNIWFDDHVGNKFRRVYLSPKASERLSIKSQCGRIHLRVTNYHDDRIELAWSGGNDEYGLGDVCCIPTSYQQVRLVHPANASVR